MPDPQTSNIGLSIPTRGSDVGTWDLPMNGDFNGIDGLFGGVLGLTISNAPITLTVPAGFVAAPGAGPVQSQNAVIRPSGAQSADVTITLPAPGFYIVENRVSTFTNLLFLRAVLAGEVIAIPQGMCGHVYNDGTNVRFVNLGPVGKMEFFGGDSAIPAWVAACTVPPFLLCDGAIYNTSQFPFLGGRLGSKFGGNGSTTFGVPDLRGNILLPYDGTGTRVTTAGCGINGQLIGALGGNQMLQAHPHPGNTGTESALHNHNVTFRTGVVTIRGQSTGDSTWFNIWQGDLGTISGTENQPHGHGFTTDVAGSGQSQNMPPAIVGGVWAIKT